MIINNNYLIMNENNLSKNPQTKVVDEKSKLKEIAYYNRNEAIQKYRTQIFQEKIMNIFENVHAGSNGTFKLD